MNKDVLEKLKATVEKNIEIIQSRIDVFADKRSGAGLDVDSIRLHHTLMRYAKLLMTIENRLASLK